MSGVCRFGYSLFTMSKTGANDRNRRRKPLFLPIHCRSPATLTARGSESGGGERDRTADLLLAKQALSQLSYTPAFQADS